MSIALNDSDFQCLQDQLVDLKTKNYELAEKNRRNQADFEAAKAKICSLQLKLEEQERDFQVISTTLRQEIISMTGSTEANNSKDENYKTRYKKLLPKAKELQQRFDKSVEIVQQLDSQNKNLSERVRKLELENIKLSESLTEKEERLSGLEKDYQDKLTVSISEHRSADQKELEETKCHLKDVTAERDSLKIEVERLTTELSISNSCLDSQNEERKIQERKGLQVVKELKRQLALEKNKTETLQKRLETLLKEPPSHGSSADLESRNKLSTSSSINENSSSNGNGSRANHDANSTGSWSFLPVKSSSSNHILNETLSLCSMGSEDRETVQQPCDTRSEESMQRNTSLSIKSPKKLTFPSLDDASYRLSSSILNESPTVRQTVIYPERHQGGLGMVNDSLLIEDQAALMERLTKLQHDKWILEERLAYMEQSNSSLLEDLANRSAIIRHYFMDQATKASINQQADTKSLTPSSVSSNNNTGNSSRRLSFPTNSHMISADKPGLRRVVEFLKERSQLSLVESESISREATKKMQLMLEETLIKCLKLQENLDFVSSELNKLKV